MGSSMAAALVLLLGDWWALGLAHALAAGMAAEWGGGKAKGLVWTSGKEWVAGLGCASAPEWVLVLEVALAGALGCGWALG